MAGDWDTGWGVPVWPGPGLPTSWDGFALHPQWIGHPLWDALYLEVPQEYASEGKYLYFLLSVFNQPSTRYNIVATGLFR